jgi:hypothetical protein
MLSTGKSPFQTSHSGSLRTHARCDLALRQARLLPRLQQGIEKSGLFAFNTLHFCPHPRPTKEFFDELIMGPHV